MASLKRHFLAWLGLAAAACVLGAAAVSWSSRYAALAQQQDQRLARALDQAVPGTAAGSIGAYPWPGELQAGDAPRFHVTHADGALLRAAAVLRVGPGAQPAVVQAAEPLADRFPGGREWIAGPPLAFSLGVLLMALVAAIAAWRARRWVMRAVGGFEAGPSTSEPAELSAALARLRELQAQQQRWVEEQRSFIAEAAHQLRTPMAVLRTQLQSALAGDADAQVLLVQMLHTVDRATGMANQLLSLSRVEQLRQSGQLVPVAVKSAVRDAIVELSPLVARKRLDFALEGDGFEAPADAVMLGEVVRNLLANAIHHGPPGSRIGVVLRGAAPLREVVVWDEGPGIDDAVKPRLFTPFSAAKGGVGLGLSICQQIAEAMGAQVRLHDRVEDGRVAGVDAVLAWRAA